MSLEEAVELVLFAFENAESGSWSRNLGTQVLAQAVKELFKSNAETQIIGIRHGENNETSTEEESVMHMIWQLLPCSQTKEIQL